MTTDVLIERVKTMPSSELTGFRLSIVYAKRFSEFTGIISFLTMFMLASPAALVWVLPVVYVVSKISVNADKVLDEVDKRLHS